MSQPFSRDEQYLARMMFVIKLLKANNQGFQQLFWSVMRAKHGQDFVDVRPQGRIGDGGNDGYLPADGHYYQVYGPIEPDEKVYEAAGKLREDFEKLRASWDRHTPIRGYSFVFNDKYEGTFTRIAQALSDIEASYPAVRCRPFTAAILEDVFMSLDADRMQSVLGAMLPDPSKIVRVDYGALRDVVTHIMSSPVNAAPTRFGDLPDLDEKIRLNNLCSAWADAIRGGARRAGHVDGYFSKNSTYTKQTLRDHVAEMYRRAREVSLSMPAPPLGINREDIAFAELREKMLPNATVAAEAAVDILIGYYFEACDVFESPTDEDHADAPP